MSTIEDAYTYLEHSLSQIEPTDNFRKPNGFLKVTLDTPNGPLKVRIIPIETGEWVMMTSKHNIDTIFADDEVLSFLQREQPILIRMIKNHQSPSEIIWERSSISDGALIPLVTSESWSPPPSPSSTPRSSPSTPPSPWSPPGPWSPPSPLHEPQYYQGSTEPQYYQAPVPTSHMYPSPSPIYESTSPGYIRTLNRLQNLLGQIQQTIPMIQQIGTTAYPLISSAKSLI